MSRWPAWDHIQLHKSSYNNKPLSVFCLLDLLWKLMKRCSFTADLQFSLFYCEKLNRNLPYSVVHLLDYILGGRAGLGQILVTRKYIYGSAPMPPRTEWLKRSETVNEIHQYRAKVIYSKYSKKTQMNLVLLLLFSRFGRKCSMENFCKMSKILEFL